MGTREDTFLPQQWSLDYAAHPDLLGCGNDGLSSWGLGMLVHEHWLMGLYLKLPILSYLFFGFLYFKQEAQGRAILPLFFFFLIYGIGQLFSKWGLDAPKTLAGNWQVLILEAVNIYRYNQHQPKLFGVFDYFQEYKGILRSKCLRTTGTD